MVGRLPKPTAIKRMEGNPGKRKLNDAEPKPEQGAPTQPHWLLPEAKREWARVVPQLLALGLLARVDRAALAQYCQWWARWVESERILARQGLTFETPNGYVQQRPEVAIAQKASDRCRMFLEEFGLSPARRASMQAPKAKQGEDEFAAFLRKTEERRQVVKAVAATLNAGPDDAVPPDTDPVGDG
jgi:P27 family predicted phage terminase small subunit